MPIARYFSEPCPACDYVEDRYIPTIEDRYNIIKYNFDLDLDRHKRYARLWSSVTNKLPTICVEGDGGVSWYIGPEGIEALYKKCKGWKDLSYPKRRVREPVARRPALIKDESVPLKKKPLAEIKI